MGANKVVVVEVVVSPAVVLVAVSSSKRGPILTRSAHDELDADDFVSSNPTWGS